LVPNDVNINQGAESMLSFLLALLAVIESYAIVDKIAAATKAAEQAAKEPVAIKGVPAKSRSKKKQVKELT